MGWVTGRIQNPCPAVVTLCTVRHYYESTHGRYNTKSPRGPSLFAGKLFSENLMEYQ